MKMSKKIKRKFVDFMIDKWCEEWPYGETCKHCDMEPVCENVHKAIEPELYNSKPHFEMPPIMDDDTMGGSDNKPG